MRKTFDEGRCSCLLCGLQLFTTNSRLHQHHQVILANGMASTLPGTPTQVRLCNVGTTTRYLKKGTVVGFAETYRGPVVATVDEKVQPLGSRQSHAGRGDGQKESSSGELPLLTEHGR